jgi:2-oxoglutarate dehydrogenase E2 component (dihydrolipoamide succinyltransferase)
MPVEIRIPSLGESVTEGVILRWMKSDGAAVQIDEPLLELETDKASVEIPATAAGVLKILKEQGTTVQVGDVVATIDGAGAAKAAAPSPAPAQAKAPPPAAAAPAAPQAQPPLSPAVRRLVEEHHLDPQKIAASGKGGRLTKGDILAHLESSPAAAPAPAVAPASATPPAAPARPEGERRVPMTHLRKRIAERLVQAQHTAAILTTFNEVDMSAVMALRAQYKERFQKVHGIGLGFMSFFAKACIAALQEMPAVNAFIDGTDVVYHDYVHLGIAVGTERGLVVPVVHDAHTLSFAQIEQEIGRLAGLARDAKLSIQDLSGGTFTISNGGVYGSLLSTPILNPPQSAILGMHKIEKRPVVVNDQIVIRPMMYLALSYDHRLVDGEQAVTFLVKIKERIEDPTRLLLEV